MKQNYPMPFPEERRKQIEIEYWQETSLIRHLLWLGIFKSWGFTLRHPIWAWQFTKYIRELKCNKN